MNSDFHTVKPKEFTRQMECIERNYAIVPLAEVLKYISNERKGSARRMVSVTFDDGYQDFYTNAYPFFLERKLPATVFITTYYVGKDWPFVEPHLEMLTWKQIEEISLNNIEIGAHTVTHPNLRQMKLEEAEHQIVKSKEEIEKHLGRPVRFFSYPFGGYTDQVLKTVENAGFEGGVGGFGTVRNASHPFTLNRVQIDSSISYLQFQARLTKAVDWSAKIEQAVKKML
jgi:peptidoglycan/xylan/chitin deacetylase (PgdA/CDA1 family)